MSISVCMATFNGDKYIKKQIDSIICQLNADDEVIFCDDGSIDQTIFIIESYGDSRFRIFKNPIKLGHVRNFEKAVSLAIGDYIFLTDQDDIWIPGRVEFMLDCISRDANLLMIASNFTLINEYDEKIGEFNKLGKVRGNRFFQILSIFLGRSPYFGCTFLLRKEFRNYCFPLPKNIESHDIWMALVASSLGRIYNISQATLLHRVHNGNLTVKKRRSLGLIFQSRFQFFSELMRRFFYLKFNK